MDKENSDKKREFSIIVAMEKTTRGIGKNETIPWKIPEDFKYFQRITTWRAKESIIESPSKKNAVLMGAATWRSIGCKPLPDRVNLIVSKSLKASATHPDPSGNFLFFDDLPSALDFAWCSKNVDNVFVIGGQKLYAEALTRSELATMYLTLAKDFQTVPEFDTFFPELSDELMNNLFQMTLAGPWMPSGDATIQFQVFEKRKPYYMYYKNDLDFPIEISDDEPEIKLPLEENGKPIERYAKVKNTDQIPEDAW